MGLWYGQAGRGGSGSGSGPEIHWVILFAPRVNSSQQRPDAGEALALEQESHTSGGDLVRTGAIHDNVPIAWKLVVTFFEVIQQKVDRSLNKRGVAFQFRAG